MAETNDGTTVTKTNEDLSTLLGQPGAESIITQTPPAEKEPGAKPSLFQRQQVDLTFLDKPDPNKKPDTDPEAAKKAAEEAEKKRQEGIANGTLNPDGSPKQVDIDEVINEGDQEADDKKKNGGRPKTDKDALIEFTKKLIEQKKITPFEGEEDISNYSIKDIEELFEANEEQNKASLKKQLSTEMFDAFPDELKAAAAYAANGGKDMKGMFRALAEYHEVAELSPETEDGQVAIARQYLQATNFGEAEEIEEQINEWKDQDLLKKKATSFKPKLDSMQEQYVKYKVAEQEALRKQQEEHANKYMQSVYQVLEPGELNGVKLDKKTQSMLYAGLVQPNYPSISGKNTNLLGHLLEKHQFVEPNHSLIAEVLWHLADPEGFKAKLKEVASKDSTIATVRKLKTEEGRRIASGQQDEGDNPQQQQGKSKGIPRPGAGFFKR